MTHLDLSHSSINESFTLENLLFSTRTADAFRGVDLSRKVAITIWLSRGAFVRHSDRMADFVNRLKSLDRLDPPVADMLSYGTDKSGRGFIVFPIIDGMPAITMLREAAEIERRFLRMLKYIGQLHQSGIICGDLGKFSFWLSRSGEISLIGAFGPDAGEVGDRVQTIPQEISGFCAPEFFKGELLDARSDVYSLGAICYYLLTGNTPPAMGIAQPVDFYVSSVMPNGSVPPVWAEDILRQSLATDAKQRFTNANEMMQTLLALKESSAQTSNMLIKTGYPMLPERSQQKILVRSKPKVTEPAEEEEAPQIATVKTRWSMILGFTALLSVACIVGSVVLTREAVEVEEPTEEEKTLEKPIFHDRVDTDLPLKEVLHEIERNAHGIVDSKDKLKGLIGSDDPVAHDTLVRLALRTPTVDSRKRIEEAIIERARRLGSIRSAEEVRTWLAGINEQFPECYEPILRSLDQTLPQDAIERYLRQAYTKAPAAVLRLTVALGFDSKDINKFHNLLAQLIGDSLKLVDSREHSAAALILADPISSAVYADDVIQNITSVPDGDIQWLLDILALRRDPNIKVIAHTAIDRNLLPPGKKIFALLLRDRDDISAALAVSLVNAVSGTATESDIAQIGNWYDVKSEPALYGIMATTTDKNILNEAFDTVAGKAKQGQIGSVLIGRVRSKYWDNRVQFARFIGTVALADEFSEEQLESAFNDIADIVSKDSQFVDAVLNSKDPKITRIVVKRLPDQLGAARLINLLSFPDTTVKLAAINLLKEYNQLQLLQLVIEAYKREKDPIVREAYKSSFWFIQEREKNGNI